MKLEVKKSLSGGVFKVDLAFKAYEVFEEGLMEDYGTPELVVPVSEWTADVEISDGKFVFSNITKDATDKECDIEIGKEIKVLLNESFRTSFEVKVADLEESMLDTNLDTKVKLAEGKCALFVEVIKQEASKKMAELREMKTSFESAVKNPEVVRI